MRYRIANTKDLSFLAELFDAYRVFYRKQSDIKNATLFIAERLNLKDSQIFVAEDANNKLVGFTQLYPLYSSTKMKKLWLLNDLYVMPQYRGKAISKALIEKAKQLAKQTNACGVFLETEKTNVIGNALYPKVGFKLNEASNYYEWSND